MMLITEVRSRRLSIALLAGVAVAILAAPTAAQAADCPRPDRWVAAWAASPTEAGTFPGYPCPSADGLHDQTVRNIVFTSAGGDRVRVRLTNVFGAQPLHVGRAAVAVAGTGAATVRRSTRALSFHGEQQRLAVSVYLPEPTGPATQHLIAQQNNYVSTGDSALTAAPDPFSTTINCWLYVDGVDVSARSPVTGAVVALGDSITDGALSTVDANRRWPDDLARRLHERPGRTLAVVNAGISGNQVLLDRQPTVYGLSALHRLDRDVLGQTGARVVILLEGVNDIGGDHLDADQLIAAYQEIIARVHARGLRIFGGTLVPFGGSHDQYGGDYGSPWGEQQRQALNQWIRTGGAFDGVIDFDRAIADPAAPDRMYPPYDSGDHLHLGDAGYAAMADAVDLDALLGTAAPAP